MTPIGPFGKRSQGGQAPAADDRDLRRDLAAAIEIRGKADKRAALAAAIADKAEGAKCAAALEAERLKPHLTRSFKLSNDPQFAEKVQDIVGLYLDPCGTIAVAIG